MSELLCELSPREIEANLQEHRRWLLDRDNGEQLDWSGKDLSGADLYFTCLRKAVLCGADLSGTDLLGANLREADLRSAVIDFVSLNEKIQPECLSNARLDGIRLHKDGEVLSAEKSALLIAEILERRGISTIFSHKVPLSISVQNNAGDISVLKKSWRPNLRLVTFEGRPVSTSTPKGTEETTTTPDNNSGP